MRLGRPQTGSCSARWRNCRSPAAISCGGAPHVAQHEADEQREAGERHRDERHHARHDLAAGPRRLSRRSARWCRLARSASSMTRSPPACAAIVDPAQTGQLQALADLVEQARRRYISRRTRSARGHCRRQDRRRSRPRPRRRRPACRGSVGSSAVLRPGFAGSCRRRRPATSVLGRHASGGPRNRSRLGAISARKVARG